MAERSAVSWDFDGVPFPRPPIQTEVFKPWDYNAPFVPKHTPITRNDRLLVTRPLTRRENLLLRYSYDRFVKPEFAQLIQKMQVDTKIGNTGRLNSIPMVEMTMERLIGGGYRRRVGICTL